ncbi:hypothetical protein ACN20G_29650 (plasmid) [Streptomyces sp. BI20]|uniref:hypothetical protein n=1 Tax=Streptomyces sp. BI20 TaxID=3403460 RepID=UPI003C70FBED
MTSTNQRDHETRYSVGVDGERFTCARAIGLGPQGDGGLPGRARTGPRDVTADETDADGRATWEPTEAAPIGLDGDGITASNRETRVTRVMLQATVITPILNERTNNA